MELVANTHINLVWTQSTRLEVSKPTPKRVPCRKTPIWVWLNKLNRRGKPQVLVHVSTYQGSVLEFRFFDPQPYGEFPISPASLACFWDISFGSPRWTWMRRTPWISRTQLPKANRPFNLLVFQFWDPIFSHGNPKGDHLLFLGPLGN